MLCEVFLKMLLLVLRQDRGLVLAVVVKNVGAGVVVNDFCVTFVTQFIGADRF